MNWESMASMKRPLGKYTPWVWSVELVRGCNLRCWHCTARMFPSDGKPRFMTRETWDSMLGVMAEVTPMRRLELAQGGEPTLHPDLLEFIRVAKKLSPTTQLQVTTNGMTLLSGKVAYEELFSAGANSVYVDMYADERKHVDMAKESGAEWYRYDRSKTFGSEGHRMANTYYGDPEMRLIILQDNPEKRLRWRRVGRLSTFLNHIDWDVAMPYGLIPVREPYERKCTLPMRYSSVDYEGRYLFCCIDFWCESAGLLGSVLDGVEGFKKYWFGRLMQSIRRRLAAKDRGGIPYCSRCNCAFSKCDWTGIWPEGSFDEWWDGGCWSRMPPLDEDVEVFADGWRKAGSIILPDKEDEDRCLRESKKLIIQSTAAVDKGRADDCALFDLSDGVGG